MTRVRPEVGDTIYAPTGEVVRVLRVANEGQTRPGDPGRGMRLFAVRFPDETTGQASADELLVIGEDRTRRTWHEGRDWPRPLRTLADVRRANADLGHHWFDPAADRFFDSRVESPFYVFAAGEVEHDGKTLAIAGFFVYSRQFHGSDGSSRPRTYHVAAVGSDGAINPAGYDPSPFPDGYPTLDAARLALLARLA